MPSDKCNRVFSVKSCFNLSSHVIVLMGVLLSMVYLSLVAECSSQYPSFANNSPPINNQAHKENKYVQPNHYQPGRHHRLTLIAANKSTTMMATPNRVLKKTVSQSSVNEKHLSTDDPRQRPVRSTQFKFPQEYFEQLNVKNHKPKGLLETGDSQKEVSISDADSSKWQALEGRSSGGGTSNVKFYSAYGRPSTATVTTTTQSSNIPNDQQPSPLVYFYPPTTNLNTSSIDQYGNPKNYPTSSWTIPNNFEKNFGSTANKKLLEEYYRRDLSSMSDKLNNQGSAGEYYSSSRFPSVFKNAAESDEDEDSESSSSSEEVNIKKYSNLTDRLDENDSLQAQHLFHYPENYKLNDQLLSEYREAYTSGEGKVYRLQQSPKAARHFESRSGSIPIRLQTAHSHSIPHASHYYTMAHSPIESDHHHYLSSEKSTSWLGSGLAAGILIGAIPFGIMMASMMPTLLTSSVPIVSTAAVGKRRRRRSSDFKNLLFDQALETVSMLMRKGLTEMTGMSERRNNVNVNHNTAKDSLSNLPEHMQNSIAYDTTESDDTIKLVTKYFLASVDEPKCIKEMVCLLLANGRKPKTSPIQKTLYLIVKWIPKDVEKSLGLNGLFGAVRRNSCFATYKCPQTMIDELRKRSRSTKISS